MARRPPRLPEFDYTGLHSYFLTAATYQRQNAFAVSEFATSATEQLLRLAKVNQAAQATSANALTFFNKWRQGTGFRWKQLRGFQLWQSGYWDYVLRQDEEPFRISAYVVNNPVRAGLVATALEYPYVGSSEYSLSELVDAAQIAKTTPWRSGASRHGWD